MKAVTDLRGMLDGQYEQEIEEVCVDGKGSTGGGARCANSDWTRWKSNRPKIETSSSISPVSVL